MAFEVEKLLRPHIASLLPYSSARDEYSGTEGVFLDANENPIGSITQESFNRYPDPYQRELKEDLGRIKSVPPSHIFLGNGSDEAIDLLFRAFCNPGMDNVILLPPTYGMYEVSANINNVNIQKVPLTRDFQLDIKGIKNAINEFTKIIFICSPNNPTGNKMRREDILQVAKCFEGLVVVDEAYIDFSDEASFTEEMENYQNLVVLQTFSKAWGLASLRLGMAYAAPQIVSILNKIKPPYNISGLTQKTVLAALMNYGRVKDMVREILSNREELNAKLKDLPVVMKVYPSDANFLLVKVMDPKRIYEFLVEKKIIVRDRSKVTLCENCLRITVGTWEENKALIAAMNDYQSITAKAQK
ncbi:histidinol-phosphate transaminase [Pleomorphovibrio marinus]|uniref:histidinol-phosphate transaminase n=1 Tax=Pleomorphovibrio marinus TaxID=2164132 RepID=UPI000E0A5C15|nr:histidinol-phosphate transaminase [Pleomorphovibrio marinus]